MTVTINKPIRSGQNKWTLKYSSDELDPVFYIYINGLLVAQTNQTDYDVPANVGENIIVEIFDDANAIPTEVFAGKIRLGWFSVEDTEYYRIDEYIDDAWVEVKRYPENNAYLLFESRFLEDCQVHQFRVTPVGSNGNEGDPKTFSVLVVRHPDTPEVSYEYSSGTAKVTITEN